MARSAAPRLCGNRTFSNRLYGRPREPPQSVIEEGVAKMTGAPPGTGFSTLAPWIQGLFGGARATLLWELVITRAAKGAH